MYILQPETIKPFYKVIEIMTKLPDLHKQAITYKNTKKLQRDGGRAWIKDSQLHESRKGANGRLVTIVRSK